MASGETLFDYMFNAWNAPQKAEQAQVETDLKRTQLQAAQIELNQKVSMAQVMQKMWGAGGSSAANAAMDDPQQGDEKKFGMVANVLLKSGDIAGAERATQAMGTIMARNTAQQKAAAQQEQHQYTISGSQAGAFIETGDQGVYTDGLPDFKANLPKQLQGIGSKLTGDLTRDQPYLNTIARASQTYNQQATGAYREQALADREVNFGITTALAREKIAQGQQRLNQQQKAQDSLDRYRAHAAQHMDNEDARGQEALDLKKLQTNGHVTVKPVTKGEADFGKSVLAMDERTNWMDDQSQATYGNMAAQIAKKYYPDLTLEEGISHALDDMQQQGLLDPKSRGGMFSGPSGAKSPTSYKGKPPATPAGSAASSTHPGLPQDYTDAQQLYEAVKKDPTLKAAALDYAKKKGW